MAANDVDKIAGREFGSWRRGVGEVRSGELVEPEQALFQPMLGIPQPADGRANVRIGLRERTEQVDINIVLWRQPQGGSASCAVRGLVNLGRRCVG